MGAFLTAFVTEFLGPLLAQVGPALLKELIADFPTLISSVAAANTTTITAAQNLPPSLEASLNAEVTQAITSGVAPAPGTVLH